MACLFLHDWVTTSCDAIFFDTPTGRCELVWRGCDMRGLLWQTSRLERERAQRRRWTSRQQHRAPTLFYLTKTVFRGAICGFLFAHSMGFRHSNEPSPNFFPSANPNLNFLKLLNLIQFQLNTNALCHTRIDNVIVQCTHHVYGTMNTYILFYQLL